MKKNYVEGLLIDENDLVTKEEYDSIEIDGLSVTEEVYGEVEEHERRN